jgi:hypothetical protein
MNIKDKVINLVRDEPLDDVLKAILEVQEELRADAIRKFYVFMEEARVEAKKYTPLDIGLALGLHVSDEHCYYHGTKQGYFAASIQHVLDNHPDKEWTKAIHDNLEYCAFLLKAIGGEFPALNTYAWWDFVNDRAYSMDQDYNHDVYREDGIWRSSSDRC